MGHTAQSLTCSIREKPHTGLDECPRILLSCFRARNSGPVGVNWCFVKERRHCLPPKSNFLMSERAEEENARVLHFFMFETIRSTSGRPANEYSLGLDKVKSGCVKLPKISSFKPSYSSADGGELHPSFMAQIYTQSLNLQARLPSLVLFTRGTLFRTSRSSK